MLAAEPLSTIRPESLLGVPVSPEDNTVSGSATDTFVVFTVVVVPLTVKLPSITKLPVTVGLASSAMLTLLFDTVVVILLPPSTVNVSVPTVTVSSLPSASTVITGT